MLREVKGPRGRYAIESELGFGSAGIVYRARRVETGELVALKILRAASDDLDLQRRFEQEARLGETLAHENIVRVHDHGHQGGRAFLVMDLVEGQTLETLAVRGKVSLDQAVRIVTKLARALGEAHRRGVVHRDVKPANVIVDASGRPVLTDFGFAKDLFRSFDLTRESLVVGTPHYMAPEQASSGRVTASVDIYALGVVLYRLATGKLPFEGVDVLQTFMLVQHGTATPPRKLAPTISRDLEAIIQRCMAKTPAARFATAEELATALESLAGATARVGLARLDGSGDLIAPARTSRLWLLAPAVVLSVVAAVLVVWFAPRHRTESVGPPVPVPPERPEQPEQPEQPARPERPGAAALARARELAAKGADAGAVRAELDRCLELERDCPEALLELAALDLESGDLVQARRHAALLAGDRDPSRREARDALTRRLADEETAQRAVLEQCAAAIGDFRSREALALLEAAAKTRPSSAAIQAKLATVAALNGLVADAVEHEKVAARLDPSLPPCFSEETRVYLRESRALGARLPEGWDAPEASVWEPLHGAVWGEKDDVLLGVGIGLGAFNLAGLVRRDAPASVSYKVGVEIEFQEGQDQGYAGIIFGARSPSDFYLAYIFHDPDAIKRAADPATIAKLQEKSGTYPKMIRLARMVDGQWSMRENEVIPFADSGFVPMTLSVDGGSSVKITVEGHRYEWNLDRELDGRVGLLKFYDTGVKFRRWEWSAGGR
jgi:hypothetical protein